jgi:hypothetical protein
VKRLLSNFTILALSENSVVIRVTDAEWDVITNHYPGYVKTEPIRFYGPIKLSHAPATSAQPAATAEGETQSAEQKSP